MSDQDATDVERRSEKRVRDPEHIIGKAIAQRYVVEKCIGQGGMGVVYTAIQQALDREVVLKVVRTDAADPDAEDRFQREARSLSRLSHPNIVQIYDHGKDQGTDLSFIAMEYVRGITLSRFCKKRGGYLPVSEFRPIAQQVLEGVAEAHRVGLIHRDLKPSNVMLTSPDGETLRVKILDFGLSKLARGGEPLTRVNQMLGSAMYMAPEQFKGGTIDARADVYALGVIFYQMLSGRRPVLGDDNYQVLMQQVGGQVTPLADALPSDNPVPPALIALIDRCLSVDPAARPHDARALQGALDVALASTQGQSAITARLIATSPDTGTGTESSTLRSNESPTQSGSNLSESHARVGMYAGLLTGGLSLLVLVLVLVLLVFLVFKDALFGSEEAAPPVAAVQQVDQGVVAANALRERALEAIRDAQYERAVNLLTEAVTMAPAQGDLKELLTIAIDLKGKAKAAPPPEPVVEEEPEPEPEPEPVARRSSPRPSPRPRPRPAPQPPPVGTAVITTIPKGIRFEIEGVGEGVTPANLSDVAAGTHAITFFWEGMPIHSDQIEVGRGAVELYDQDLEPMIPKPEPEPVPEPEPEIAVAVAPPPPEPEPEPEPEPSVQAVVGELLVESPNVYGDIWIDGRNFGKPPVVAKDLPPGAVKVEVRVGSKVRREATATVEPDHREKLTIR